MRNIAVIGTGYVGLVTGVCLAEIGHRVTCIDIDKEKIDRLKSGDPVIFENNLTELLMKNIDNGRLSFTTNYCKGLIDKEVVYITVGTPQNNDGTINLTYIKEVAKQIAKFLKNDCIIVTKSTVPVGTNEFLLHFIKEHITGEISLDIVSNPEFLREGSAIEDTFHGERIVIGSNSERAANVLEEINQPFQLPILKTDIRSAEMIKYASNAFLATKISFINEIANICERTGADVEEVAKGMALDKRIGPYFLRAGIGYGGSCFPKDTNALIQLAGNHEYDFNLLRSVIEVNNKQRLILIEKAKKRFGELEGLKAAILGLAFKPNTDDIRESPALVIIPELLKNKVDVAAYDPVAINNARKVFSNQITYSTEIEEVLSGADFALILTDWDSIINIDLETYRNNMKQPIIFDGRNVFKHNNTVFTDIEYYSIGRHYSNDLHKMMVKN